MPPFEAEIRHQPKFLTRTFISYKYMITGCKIAEIQIQLQIQTKYFFKGG